MIVQPVGKNGEQSEKYLPLLDFKTKDPFLRQNHEIGFLVALLIFLILQFVFFYFGLPQLTNVIIKNNPLPNPQTELSIIV